MRAQCGDINIAWHEIGRGRPLVLIHGLADDHRAWRRSIPPLVMDHRIILYDFRGHGETDLGDARGTVSQLAADLVALLDAVQVDAAVLAGFSLGGTVAMRAALDHPERVRGLALIGTSSRVNSAAAQWYRERASLALEGGTEFGPVRDKDTEDVYRNRPQEIEDGLLIRRQSTADPRGYANACQAMNGLHDEPLDPELSQIQVPSMVVAGDVDQHCPPRAGEIIVNAIPGATLEVFTDTGHPIPVERPEMTAAAIKQLASKAWSD